MKLLHEIARILAGIVYSEAVTIGLRQHGGRRIWYEATVTRADRCLLRRGDADMEITQLALIQALAGERIKQIQAKRSEQRDAQ